MPVVSLGWGRGELPVTSLPGVGSYFWAVGIWGGVIRLLSRGRFTCAGSGWVGEELHVLSLGGWGRNYMCSVWMGGKGTTCD